MLLVLVLEALDAHGQVFVESVNVWRRDVVGGGKERCGWWVSCCLYPYWDYIGCVEVGVWEMY